MLKWKSAMDAVQTESEPASVHILVGTDYLLANWYIEKLQSASQEPHGLDVEIQRFRFEEEGADGAVQACQTLSLFATQSIVVLEHCSAFLPNQKGKVSTELLESYMASPLPGKVLVITVHGVKLDERKKLAKLAKAHRMVDCSPPQEADALGILHPYCRQRGYTIDDAALAELWRRTQTISSAVTELDKLDAFVAGGAITSSAVQELVSPPPEDNVFAWIDGVVKGQIEKSFRVLSDLQRSGYDTFALYAMIARQFRLMWYAKVLGGQGYSQQQIASRAGAHPYAVKVAAEQAKWISQKKIEELLTVVADAEFAVKSGRREPGQALEWVLMACATSKPANQGHATSGGVRHGRK